MKFRIYISIILAGSILIVAALYALSKKPNQNKNGFKRSFIDNPILVSTKYIDLKTKALYISGTSDSKIYLGNIISPNQLIITDTILNKIEKKELNINENKPIAWKLLKIKVDSPFVYAYEELTPTLLKGFISNKNLEKVQIENQKISEIMPIKEKSYLVKTFDTTSKKNALKQFSTNSSTAQVYYLGERNDNLFKSAGKILFNKQLSQIIYIYYFKNGYIILDTLLKEKSRGNTIDTIYHSNLKTGEIKTENAMKLLAGSIVVNKYACTSDNKLYIKSALKSDNEKLSDFNKYDVIDVYDLKLNIYLKSFYLTKYKDFKFYDFCIFKNKMIVLYENYLVSFNV